MKYFYLFLISTLLFSSNLSAQRESIDFNKDWKFHFGHANDIRKDFNYGASNALQFAKLEPAPYGGHGIPATLLNLNEDDWKMVTIPHDWAVDLPYDFEQHPQMGSRYGYKPIGREYPETSVGWYRKKFEIGKADEGKRFAINFEGVFRNSMIWVNGFYIGRNWSGYSGFQFNISDYLIYGKENIVTLRVDAGLHEGWFYEGAGINKEVTLVKTQNLHIDDIGPQISTQVIGSKALVKANTTILNESYEDHNIYIINEIVDDNGVILATQTGEKRQLSQRSDSRIQQELTFQNPKLWSLENPNRYKLISKVILNNKVIDQYKTKFGIRTIKFNADKGFILNSERTQIKGVCIHQNFAGVGSALNEALHIYRLNLLKEMGINAIRSHYPFSKSMLNACDSLGMLVMDETRAAGSTPEALKQISWMVRNHRNHPSIIIWSMANEEGGTQRDIIGKRYMKQMVAEAHKYDSTRLVTAGVNAWGGKVDFGFSEAIDVMGFNYSTEFIDEYHKNHPSQPIIGTEVSNSTVTRGYYEFSENNKSVIVSDGIGGYYMPENELEKEKVTGHIAANQAGNNQGAYNVFKFYAEREYLAGSFFWTGFDYNGEIWPSEAPNNSSQFGAMDIAGFPKPMYYFYKAWWTNEPVLHIAQHWNWNGMEGKEIDVLIHGNCDEVELFLNDKSLGKKEMQKYGHLNWKVKYTPGTLKAVGYKKRAEIISDELVTSDIPNSIKLTPDSNTLKADGKDISVVRVEIEDANKNVVALANNKIEFVVEGDAQILGTGNGHPSSAEIDSHPNRKVFNGKAIVIIQSGNKKGTFKLIAKSQGLESNSIIFNQE